MKSLIKIFVSLLLLAGTYSFLNAQIGLGIRGGVNFVTAELEEKIDGKWQSEEMDFIPRINVGLIGEIGLTEIFAFQPEVNFIQKGYKTTIVNGTSLDYKVYMDYIEVPLLFKGRFGSEVVKFNVLAGPTFGYAFNGTAKIGSTETDIDYDRDQIKRTDIGAMLGLGAEFKAGPGSFFLDTRLGWGITNLNDSDNADHAHWHNRGLSAGIGYIFRLTK